MKNPVRALWAENAFYVLGIAPSASAAEIRRALDTARLEVSMGLRQLAAEDLERLALSLNDEESTLEMRIFSEWYADPILAIWADEHDPVVAAFLHPHQGNTPVDTLRRWSRLLTPELAVTLAEFGPSGPPIAERWTAFSLEAVRKGLREGCTPFSLVEVIRAGRMTSPTVLLLEIAEDISASFDAVVSLVKHYDRAIAQGEAADREAAEIIKQMTSACRTAERTLAAMRRPEPLEGYQQAESRVLGQAREAAMRASTAFHNSRRFRDAEQVIVFALALPFPADAAEELTSEVRIVRKVEAQVRFSAAMESKDYQNACTALQAIIDNCDDADERQEAAEILPRLLAASKESRRHPAARLLGRAKGWLVTAAVIGGLAVWGELDSNDDSSSANSTSGVQQSTSRSSPPVPGDCVSSSDRGVRVVPCTSSNDGRVLLTVNLRGTTYPTTSSIKATARRECPTQSRSYLYPTEESWGSGDRTMFCLD